MSRPWHTSRWLWAGLLLAALGVRIGAALWWQMRLPAQQRFAFGDSESYWHLGQKLARGMPYEYGDPRGWKIFRTPGYPLLLAGVLRIVPANRPELQVLAARMLGGVMGCFSLAGVAAIAWRLFGSEAAWWAGVITAIYPEHIAASIFVLSEAPFGPAMVAHLLAWMLAWKAPTSAGAAGWSLVGGIAAGIGTLIRPSWLLFTPFALGLGLVVSADRRRHLLTGLVMAAGFAATMSPWWIRNYLVAERFVPTSLQVGTSLYDGLHPGATGASEMSFVPVFAGEQQRADAQAAAAGQPLAGLFEDRLDQRLQAAAIGWSRNNAGAAIQLAGRKFLRMWSPVPNAGEFRSLPLRLILAVSYTPVMLLALIGAWKFARRGWAYQLCLLPAVYFTLLHMIFVSSIRYRQPAMLMLVVLAAGAAHSLVSSRKPRTES